MRDPMMNRLLRRVWLRVYWSRRGLRQRIYRLRCWWRPPAAVLWGGRTSAVALDWQIGSPQDRLIQRRRDQRARQDRAFREFVRGMGRIGLAFEDATRRMNAAVQRMNDALPCLADALRAADLGRDGGQR